MPAPNPLPLDARVLEPLAGAVARARAVSFPHVAAQLRALPWPAGVALVLAGLFALTFGARWFRPLAAVGGGALGYFAGLELAPLAGFSAPVGGVALGTALCVLCAIYPSGFLFAAGAWPGALIGAHLAPRGDQALGFGSGFVLGGAVLLAFGSVVTALAAALAGSALFLAGLTTLSRRVGLLDDLVGHPLVLLAIGVLLAVAGAAFQYTVHGEALAGKKGAAGKGKNPGDVRAKPVDDAEARRRWEKYIGNSK